MTDHLPSKDLITRLRAVAEGGVDFDCPITEHTRLEIIEAEEACHAAIVEIQRLRTALTGVSTCSTCEACRGAARLALGGVTPEPPCGPGDTGYTEMLERIRDEVGVEIFDMQHPHTWFRAARAAQPPGDVRPEEC